MIKMILDKLDSFIDPTFEKGETEYGAVKRLILYGKLIKLFSFF